ncbi:glycoside hydrolase family 43 protein [Neobacillus cucumis]|uniref:glycoside hydrolase family 43 protein n=1 Tax=Neobacillus cucumis TaxID=1740721 RepID=UPI00203D0003|nr:glycoside hydrolase family 43 protein [Neobacillus cucumis]MCM3725739.1 glycoside hydrolase family 43 protein [Neobacillus cucumis]
MLTKDDIRIRDPFILSDRDSNTYYLYGTTDENVWNGPSTGFDAYKSSDLKNWEGPYQVFRPDAEFWADQHFWAPEVFYHNDRYYMFASFKADGKCRGTQILTSNDPLGPFHPLTEEPVTPRDWECLDGTLFIDEHKNPWLIFCHEWLQVHDGEICAVRLALDFKSAIGDPIVLIKASDAKWTIPVRGDTDYVTDGPFIYQTQNGGLLMIWSSRSASGYAVGIARSLTGTIDGPWIHEEQPLMDEDGGHGMLFKTFKNELMLTIHAPNQTPNERPIFLLVEEQNGKLEVIK